MSIIFLLPHDGIVPAGGYKVVYEYANRLACDGFDITLVYPNTKAGQHKAWAQRAKDVARYVVRYLNRGFRSKWFVLEKSIKLKWVWSLESYRPARDSHVVATAIETAYSLNAYRDVKRKFYFIQGYENWFYTDKQVTDSYHFPMTKIVIARWLQQKVAACGEKSFFVPNGFDFNFFFCKNPIERRNHFHLIYMYHVDRRKGVDVAFRAFEWVHARYPQIKVSLFSVYDSPTSLSDYFSFTKQPSKEVFNNLYNDAAIYVGSSSTEGWGLTVGEAMQCGCAVACTDNKGYLEMARDGETALVSPVGDAKALADNIIRLIEDDELRIKIATAGEMFIHNFDIERSYEKFKAVVTGNVDTND